MWPATWLGTQARADAARRAAAVGASILYAAVGVRRSHYRRPAGRGVGRLCRRRDGPPALDVSVPRGASWVAAASLCSSKPTRPSSALHAADGTVAWRREEASPKLTAAFAADSSIAYMVKRGPADKPKMPALVWLEAASGRLLGSVDFPQWQDNDPRVGPLLSTGDRLWAFFSREKDPNKDLVELCGAAIPSPRCKCRERAGRNFSRVLLRRAIIWLAGWRRLHPAGN